MSNIILPVALLIASLLFNWYLYEEAKKLAIESTRYQIEAEGLQKSLEIKLQESKKNEETLKKYQAELNNITAQRDSYRRKMQEALKDDTEFAGWSADRLPAFVTDSFKRLRKERSDTSSRQQPDSDVISRDAIAE